MTSKNVENIKDSQKELKLIKSDKHYEIISNGVFLKSTHGGKSEIEMVKDGLFYLSDHKLENIRILIGGLGVGYSLIPAVEDERVEVVDVVEIHKEVINWNYQYFSEYNKDVINSDKVRVFNDDIGKYLEENSNKYDLILLDVDNGPDWLVRPENYHLYQSEGLNLLSESLALGGYIGIWTISEKQELEANLIANFDYVIMRSYQNIDSKRRSHYDYVYFSKTGK
ncbi:spermidine synthase [Natranaerobius trueperi]|nr:spermidine synthase [Natranaerobius trueperi]